MGATNGHCVDPGYRGLKNLTVYDGNKDRIGIVYDYSYESEMNIDWLLFVFFNQQKAHESYLEMSVIGSIDGWTYVDSMLITLVYLE